MDFSVDELKFWVCDVSILRKGMRIRGWRDWQLNLRFQRCSSMKGQWRDSDLLYVVNESELPRGYSQNIWVGVCGPLPKTLTLFMTKIYDFPYPIYDLTKNFIPYLWPDSSCYWLYLACVAGVKWGNGRQCADGRGRVWWRSCFF